MTQPVNDNDYPTGTALVPTTEYIYRHIVPNPNSTKPYGQAVYYGRKVMYKNSCWPTRRPHDSNCELIWRRT